MKSNKHISCILFAVEDACKMDKISTLYVREHWSDVLYWSQKQDHDQSETFY